MLQTEDEYKVREYYCTKEFQVPKGMLQTYSVYVSNEEFFMDFKSPRECYKHSFSIFLDKGTQISSPQGNATNLSHV